MAKTEVSTIGKYQILERIATGELAEIFKARLEGIAGFRRLFAIKRVRPHLARNTAYAQLIEEEARIAGLLSHGNIVQLLDLGRDGGSLYLVMEYVDGWDLGKILAAARASQVLPPIPHLVFLGIQVLKALEYAHHREVVRDGEAVPLGLVHRDISPSNIMLSRQGEVKLTDFGIARAALKMMETRPDLLRRTFEYMSPEAARGHELTASADLFAVGLVLYECLTLHHPFRREGEMATLEAVQEGKLEPLRSLRPEVPERLAEVIEAALSVDPAQRPATATAFKDELAAVLHESGEVFNQERMAAWLSDLLGVEEIVPGPRQRPLTIAEITALTADELPELPADADHTVPAPYPVVAPDADDEAGTVVMSLPIPRKAEPDAAVLGDDEGATVVQPDLAGRIELLRKAKDRPVTESDATRVRPAPRKAAAGASGAWMAGAISGGLALIIGVLLGAVLTAVYVRAGGMMVNPPMLDVRGDPGVKMTVMVDAQPMATGAQRLTAGRHTVKVEVEGSQPWEFDLELQSGEYRVMVITAHQGDPKPNLTPR